MGSRLLPMCLAAGALSADAAGLHRIAYYLVLLTVVGAAAAAFAGVGDVLEGKGGVLRAATTVAALALVLLGSAVRAAAPTDHHVPVLAVSALVAALASYALPVLAWLARPTPQPQPVSP